jgi:putative glutathione S-transferase
MIGLSVTHWLMADSGWTFEPGPGVVADPLHSAEFIWELYKRSDPHYTGRTTVPVLWDKGTSQIVSNESAQIIRMFNSAFDHLRALRAHRLQARASWRDHPTLCSPPTFRRTRPRLTTQ